MNLIGFSFDETFDAWADITIKEWRQKMNILGFTHKSGHLYDSLPEHGDIQKFSSGEQAKIRFGFNYYGRMIDAGQGRGSDYGNRKAKEWYSKTMYQQTMRLKEIMADRFKNIAVNRIHNNIDQMFTAQKRSVINSRNYALRRTKAGRWTNNHKTWKPYNYKELRTLSY